MAQSGDDRAPITRSPRRVTRACVNRVYGVVGPVVRRTFASMAPRLPLYLLSQLRTLSCRAQSIELGIGALETGDAVLAY